MMAADREVEGDPQTYEEAMQALEAERARVKMLEVSLRESRLAGAEAADKVLVMRRAITQYLGMAGATLNSPAVMSLREAAR